ncbi:uncharacterized protein LOC116180546 isoform X3 [Photinus pyralis]|nr:uncharacterized protein LOC116180546 isoform X3 [Photinus pyralis]
MDPPPHKRPRMGLLPQTQPQLGLNNLEGSNPFHHLPNHSTISDLQTAQPPVEVSSTTGQISPITPAPASANGNGLTVPLSRRRYTCLKSKEGKIFRTLLEEGLGVAVRCDYGAGSPACTLQGCAVNLKKAETAVLTFCEIRSVKLKKISQTVTPRFNVQFSDDSIRGNLRILNDSNIAWFDYANSVHDRILQHIGGINECSEHEYNRSVQILMTSYRQLNAIIIGKLQYGDGKRYLEILQKSADYDHGTVQKAFNYVFNSDKRLFSDYGDALAKLSGSHSRTAAEDFNKVELERLRRGTELVCGRNHWPDDAKRILRLYIKLIIGGYQADDVEEFRNECRKLEERQRTKGGHQTNAMS